ncbi:MAG: PepSY domain-containing protein [Nocardioidaceae bacterium]|nr:MAG: PepSY domain-containing protein [Nocardioidaceae bacterium]
MTFKLVPAAAAGSLLALTLTACGNDSVSSGDAEDSAKRAVAAVTLAESEVGGTAFELDEEGRSGWDVDLVADNEVTEVRVNRDGTKVEKAQSDGRIDADDRLRLERATVSLADAITTAAGEVTGLVKGVELDRHRVTTVVWKVEIYDGDDDIDVSVDVSSGEVVNVDRD